MKTFPITDDNGQLYAFEIWMDYISLRALTRVLTGVESVGDIRRPAAVSQREGARLEFECGEKTYVVWEPYGDNSRYWIGPLDEDDRCDWSQFQQVENALRSYRTPLPRRILGDLLSLNLRGIFRAE